MPRPPKGADLAANNVSNANAGRQETERPLLPLLLALRLLLKHRLSDNAGGVKHFLKHTNPCTPKSAPFRSS
jgi:hypothetical protein